LVPISGGTDSALTYYICAKAKPGDVVGVYRGERLRAKDWFESLGKVLTVDAPGEFREQEEMRWARFLTISIIREYGLVGSRTRTEDLLGTYSLASRIATFLPIVGVWKSDILQLCNYIGVPKDIISSSTEPDCDCGRPAKLVDITYPLVDTFLKSYVLGEDVDLTNLKSEDKEYLQGIINYTSFRKDLPISGPII